MNSLKKFSLLDVILDSLKAFAFKEKRIMGLNLTNIVNCLFCQDFDAHDALGDCKALSELMLATIPDMNIKQFE